MSDSDPQGRPRPAYGEYATAEEQAARIRRPEVTTALEAGQSPAAAAPAASQPAQDAAGAPAQPAAGSPVAAARPRFADRMITFALLGYGLFTVIGSIPAAADYPQFAAAFLGTFGVDQALSDPAGARGWGLAAALVLGIGWLATFAVSWVNLRAGRLSFWIPLVGAVVVNMVASILLIAPLAADPAVWDALQNSLFSRLG
jgi:hypothetical protein